MLVLIDQQRPWLLRQVEIDTSFLQRLNVLDYSLLVGHQPLHQDERHQGLSFATLIMRTKKWVEILFFFHSFLMFTTSPRFNLFRWLLVSINSGYPLSSLTSQVSDHWLKPHPCGHAHCSRGGPRGRLHPVGVRDGWRDRKLQRCRVTGRK